MKFIGVTRRSTSLVIQTIHVVDCQGQCGGAGYYYYPIITFMHGIYNYIPEVLQLFCIYNLCNIKYYFAHEICFFLYVSTFCSMCAAPKMAGFFFAVS